MDRPRTLVVVRLPRFAFAFLLVLLGALFAAPASAQSGTPPDIVRLNSGGMLRGVIIESVPGERVVIQLPTGETRTVPAGDVRYAGPADEEPETRPEPNSWSTFSQPEDRAAPAPAPAPPPPTPDQVTTGRSDDRGGAQIRLLSDPPGYTLWLADGGATLGNVTVIGTRRVCTAPCVADVPPGRWGAWIDVGDGRKRTVGMVDFRTGTYRLERRSRRGVRIFGWTLIVTSVLTSAILFAVGASTDAAEDFDDPDPRGALLFGGGYVLLGGVFAGVFPLAFAGRDRGRVVRVDEEVPAPAAW